MIRPTNLTNTLMLMLLLGTSPTLAGALGMLLMSGVVVVVYGACIGPLRSRLSGNNLMLASLLLAATLTSCANILAQRWALQWQQSLGIYAGLIALQCVVLEYNGFFRQAFGLRLTFFGRRAGCYWRWRYCVNCSVRATSAVACRNTGKAWFCSATGCTCSPWFPAPSSCSDYCLPPARPGPARPLSPRKHITHECRQTSGNFPQTS